VPRLSTWFVRSSLVYLALGFTLGAILLVNKGLAFLPQVWKLLPIHIEMLLMGWFVQLAAGVGYWILPRLSGERPRGDVRITWLAFWLINLGIGLVILETLIPLPGILMIARLVELVGVLAFIINTWERVKSFAS